MTTDWGIVGQPAAVAYLRRSLETGRTRHAYIFNGPPNTGKAALALAFAQALNCHESEPPCGNCRSCTRFARGIHPDLLNIGLAADAKSDTGRLRKNISISQIQELQAELALQPYEADVRVVIIDGAELMSIEAANALLKTLEEPPDHAVLILLTTDAGLLLPTVQSRCQRIDLRLAPAGEIAKALEERWGQPPDHARLISHIAAGRTGWAISAAQSPEILQQRAERLDALLAALSESTAQRLERAGRLATQFNKSREDVYATLELWQGWLRDVLVAGVWRQPQALAAVLRNIDQESSLLNAAEAIAPGQARSALDALDRCRIQLGQNVNARLALEAALIALPRIPALAT